jgi:O-antigen/teichoic acid export membrane protein
MLLRHSAYYLLARGIPGLVNFFALALYTRLLAPEHFGQYALVLAGVGLANVVVFQWLRLVVARFLSGSKDASSQFLAGILAVFLVLALVAAGAGVCLVFFWRDPVWQRLVALAVPLLLVQAWFELNLDIARAQLKPAWYGKLLTSKSLIALVLGGMLAWIGLGAIAPIVGLLIAHSVSFMPFALIVWHGVRPRWDRASVFRDQLRYGLPLAITFALGWVVTSSDRLLIVWLADESAVGVYSAGYDLTFQSLTLLLSIINTAAYPLAVDALDKRGEPAALSQLGQNGALVFAVALGGAATLIALRPQLVNLLIGEAFRDGALLIFPWITIAAAIAGIKAYHFDIAFHLGRESRWLVGTGAVTALSNLALNLFLIPKYGILGAALATLGAFAFAAITSIWLGKRTFVMVPVFPIFVRGAIVAILCGGAAWFGASMSNESWVALGLGAMLAVTCGFLASVMLNIAGMRDGALALWRGRRSSPVE